MSLSQTLMLVGIFLGLSLITVAQDHPELHSLYSDNVVPIAQFGWGIPYDAVYTPDSQHVAIATGAGVTFYDHNLAEVRYIDTYDHSPEVIAISPNGEILATGSNNVYLWDIETGQHIDTLITGYKVSDIAFSSDGTQIAVSKIRSTREMNGILIFETASGRIQHHLKPTSNTLFQQIAFGFDNQYLLAIDCCHAGILGSIDIETQEIQQLIGSEAFTVSSNESKIISFTNGWTILENIEIPVEPSASISHPSRFARAISPINDDGLFSGVLENGDYGQWDSNSLNPVSSGALDFQPYIAAISPDGTWFTAISRDGLIISLNIETGEQTTETYLYTRPDVLALVGDRVFFVTNQQQLAQWNIWTNEYQVYDNLPDNIARLIVGGAEIYVATQDGTIHRLSPFDLTDSSILFEQPNTRIISMSVQTEGDLYVVVCEYGEGKLLRLDATTGQSLGFYPDFEADEATLPSIDLPLCNGEIIAKPNTIFYQSGGSQYQFDGQHANTVTRTQIPLHYTILHVDANPFTFIHKSGAFYKSSSHLTLLTSHAYDITAFVHFESSGLVASSACYDYLVYGNDYYCYGVDMTATDTRLNRRTSLNSHSRTVRQIIPHPYLQIFVSLSEDGTIIVWGAPIESQVMRREGLLGLKSG